MLFLHGVVMAYQGKALRRCISFQLLQCTKVIVYVADEHKAATNLMHL